MANSIIEQKKHDAAMREANILSGKQPVDTTTIGMLVKAIGETLAFTPSQDAPINISSLFDSLKGTDYSVVHDDLITYLAIDKMIIKIVGAKEISMFRVPLNAKEMMSYTSTSGAEAAWDGKSMHHLLIAGTAGGKTVSAKQMLTNAVKEDSSIKAGMITMAEAERPMYGSGLQIFLSIHCAKVIGMDYLLIDSLRSFYNDMSGNLKSGGVSRTFDGYLTAMDQMARRLNISLITTVNPSDDGNKAAVKALYSTGSRSIGLTSRIESFSMKSDGVSFVSKMMTHDRRNRSDRIHTVAGRVDSIIEQEAIDLGIVQPPTIVGALTESHDSDTYKDKRAPSLTEVPELQAPIYPDDK